MPRAPREQAVEQPPDRPAPAPVRAPALEGPAAVMFLQSSAGNQAVARSLARRALQREPASPGVDHAADASNVTITFVMRDLNLRSRASTIDFLHEPGVSFQVAPKEAPQPVVAEFHVSSTFSMTASTAVEASLGSSVDLKWSPMSIGVLYKLDGSKPPPREEGKDSAYYEKIQPGRKVIFPPDGKGTASVVRYKRLAIDSAPAAPVAPPEPPPARTWGTDPPPAAPAPAPSGPTIVGPSKVVPAPPPVLGVPKHGPAAPVPRTWGVGPPATP